MNLFIILHLARFIFLSTLAAGFCVSLFHLYSEQVRETLALSGDLFVLYVPTRNAMEQIPGSLYQMNSCVKRQVKRRSISRHPCCQTPTATTRAFLLEFVLDNVPNGRVSATSRACERASTAEGNEFDTLADACSAHSDNRPACITYSAMFTHERAPCMAAPFQKATVAVHSGSLLLPRHRSPPLCMGLLMRMRSWACWQSL